MSGLALSETPFSKFGPYFQQLESKLAILELHFRGCRCYSVKLYYGAVLVLGTHFDPVSRQTSQPPVEEVIVFKQQPRGAIRHETNLVSCVTSHAQSNGYTP